MFEKITLHDYSIPLVERAKRRKTFGPYTLRPRYGNQYISFYMECVTSPAPDAWPWLQTSSVAPAAHGGRVDLRIEEANDHLTPGGLRNITGYATTAAGLGGDVLSPIVARLPRGRGFLAGWTMGEGMISELSYHVYDDGEDAALAAHAFADCAAEDMRSDEIEASMDDGWGEFDE
jgi:hypothetical protein